MNPIAQHIIPILLVFQFSLFGTSLIGQAYEARLDMDWEDGSTLIEGLFKNNTSRSLSLNFQLIIERKSKTGNVVNNRQSGSFQVQPNREKLVTLTNINIDELDFYRIYFKIYKKGKVIAEDYIVKWEELGLELSDRNRVSNEETNKSTSENTNQQEKKPTINFYNKKEANKQKTSSKLATQTITVPEKPLVSTELKTTKQTELLEDIPEKISENKQNKKQTYTTPIVQTKRKPDNHATQKVLKEEPKVIVTKDKEKRQQATKNLLAELIEQQQVKAKQAPESKPSEVTKAPISTPSIEKKPTKELVSADVEFGGLIFDDSRTKTGRDFYDIFYSNYIPPKGAENFNITIKELPGRGRMAQVAVLVNDNQVLLRLLQPRATLIEEQAIQSVYAIEAYLRNAAQLKKQLESADQQGSGIF